MLRLAVVFCVLVALAYAAEPIGSGRGWNDKIEWYSYSEGLKKAGETGQPMMFLFHSTRCGACKRLQPDFAANPEIEKLSQNFVMVNIENDEQPHDQIYRHDGAYIPRVYFTDSQGQPDYSVDSGNAKYKFFYGSSAQIAQQMKAVSDRQ